MKAPRLDKSCTRICWAAAAVLGVVFLLIAWAGFGMEFFKALVWAVVIFVVVGAALRQWLCGRTLAPSHSSGGAAVSPKPAEPAAPAPAAPATPAAAAPAPAPSAEPKGEAPAAPAPAPEPAAATAAPAAGPTRPAALAAPEGGKADDLKKIKGIGPKLEALCNSLGIYHFAQIAGWSAAEVAWMDDNLEGFKGRVSRDDWVAQAKLLAEGGTTEFSKRVDKGGVY
jgi:predicted flap endonuclease-1-like 5' DNA nuclease